MPDLAQYVLELSSINCAIKTNLSLFSDYTKHFNFNNHIINIIIEFYLNLQNYKSENVLLFKNGLLEFKLIIRLVYCCSNINDIL